jgi:hypothetical protein
MADTKDPENIQPIVILVMWAIRAATLVYLTKSP